MGERNAILRRLVSFSAVSLAGFAALLLLGGCGHQPGASKASGTDVAPLAPSPRLIVGRVLAIDASQGFAFVELAVDAPAAALADGTPLICRTLDLKETARLQVSRYVRGRTLGTKIVAGQPSPTDEVVWLAP